MVCSAKLGLGAGQWTVCAGHCQPRSHCAALGICDGPQRDGALLAARRGTALRCAALRCAVLCCAVLCCAVQRVCHGVQGDRVLLAVLPQSSATLAAPVCYAVGAGPRPEPHPPIPKPCAPRAPAGLHLGLAPNALKAQIVLEHMRKAVEPAKN